MPPPKVASQGLKIKHPPFFRFTHNRKVQNMEPQKANAFCLFYQNDKNPFVFHAIKSQIKGEFF